MLLSLCCSLWVLELVQVHLVGGVLRRYFAKLAHKQALVALDAFPDAILQLLLDMFVKFVVNIQLSLPR